MMDELFLLPVLLGLMVVVSFAPLGSFMIWRRLSFFGDMIAHASLAGLVLAMWAQISPFLGVALISLVLALFMVRKESTQKLGRDARLAILSHAVLGVGLFALSLTAQSSTLLSRFLLGDILAAQEVDLLVMATLMLLTVGIFVFFWKPFLSLTIHEDLATVEGKNPVFHNALFMMILALNIALAAKFLGVLLMTALLILPASTARFIASSPRSMIFCAAVVGILGLLLGFFLSYQLDTATSPSIVTACTFLFIVVSMGMRLLAYRKI